MALESKTSLSRSFMEMFAECNLNIVEMNGAYDPISQTWLHTPSPPSMRTNYQTWHETQRTTSTHTANGDYVPDYPGDYEPDTASD